MLAILALSAHGGQRDVGKVLENNTTVTEEVIESSNFEKLERKLVAKKSNSPKLPLTIEDAPEPEGTTGEDREKGWKLVKAAAGEAFRYHNPGYESDVIDSLAGVFELFSLTERAPIFVHLHFYKPARVEKKLACQLYYNGKKEKRRGKKIGVTSVLPRNKLKTLQKGDLLIKMKGPQKKHPPPMRLVCGEQKSLPKILSSETPDELLMIDVVAASY